MAASLWLSRARVRWDTDQGIRHSDQRGYWLVPSVHVEDAPGCDDGHDYEDDHDDD